MTPAGRASPRRPRLRLIEPSGESRGGSDPFGNRLLSPTHRETLGTPVQRLERFPAPGSRARTGGGASKRGNAMLGLMQDRPLLISQIIDFAGRYYPDVEIVTPHGRGADPPLRLQGRGEARQAAGRGPAGAGHQARRSGRHHRLEHLSPLRALFRHLRHRRRAAHAQPAAGARARRLYRQPRRGQGDLRRSQPAADRRGRVAASQDGEACRGHDRPRPHAGLVQDPQPAVLRGADRRQAGHARSGPTSTSARRRRSATPRARRATPRACSTRTARR